MACGFERRRSHHIGHIHALGFEAQQKVGQGKADRHERAMLRDGRGISDQLVGLIA